MNNLLNSTDVLENATSPSVNSDERLGPTRSVLALLGPLGADALVIVTVTGCSRYNNNHVHYSAERTCERQATPGLLVIMLVL
jgi:hypothetical protein